jgi:adenine-specific DNA-methyltransferase
MHSTENQLALEFEAAHNDLRGMTRRITRTLEQLGRGAHIAGVCDVIPKVRRGEDPLGEHYLESISPAERRNQGATFTPPWVVELQLERIAQKCRRPARVIDPGAGTGRYAIAAARKWPDAEIIAVERDPVLAQAAQLNIALARLPNVKVICSDYLDLVLPRIAGVSVFVGNPPYVRHHEISEKAKRWYTASMETLNLPANQLAGLHVYFFLKSLILAKPGDVGSFITASEWFDNGYGTDMRALFGRMGGDGIVRANPTEQIFVDALTTSVISEWIVGTNSPVRFCDLLGRQVQDRFLADRNQLLALEKWPTFGRELPAVREGAVLGQFFKVSRGQVTGCNPAFIATRETAELVPQRFLFPCITDAADVIDCDGVLRSSDHLRRVIDLPARLEELTKQERSGVEQFLKVARAIGAADSYVAKHRNPWWRVGLKPAPPIVMTYMGRRPPAFARNACCARLLNIAHSLTPHSAMSVVQINRWVQWLNENVEMTAGRIYGGGLVKFEPGEAEKISIPLGGVA